MGTNYYAKINICPTCKRPEEEIHLGKSSYGWKFMFQYNGGKMYQTAEEMRRWLVGKVIEDEYGKRVSQKAFWKMVHDKQNQQGGKTHDGTMKIEGYDFFDREFS